MIFNLGKINLSGKILIADPGLSGMDTKKGVLNVKPGEYTCYIEANEHNTVTKLEAYLDATVKPSKLKPCASVSVDCCTAAIMDFDYITGIMADKAKHADFIAAIRHDMYEKKKPKRHAKACILDDKCVVSSTGMGDGTYDVYCGKNAEGEIVSLVIEYPIW